MRSTYEFPDSFLLGAATASHQVEGGNHSSDWWAAEQNGEVPHESGAACGHYELYEHDFDLARRAGHNAHRLSIEWSRIEPSQGQWNHEALDHYGRVLDALEARDIEPIVTLQHFTLPAWLAERGGWSDRASVRFFARFAALASETLGSRVRYWVTINEPTVYVKHAYVVGDWPPRRRRAWRAATRAFVHMAQAHRAARERIRALDPDALVGFAHSAAVVQPCDPGHTADRLAAWLRDVALNRAFFALVQGRSNRPRPFDFIGLNYYTRTIVRGGHRGSIPFAGVECTSDHHPDRGARSDTGWEVYPDGLEHTLRRFARLGVPLLVTENGVATSDEALRTEFLAEHLARVGHALRDGIDVRGYLYWSLMDNFEWTLGTTARYGLYEVDFDSHQRRPRPALELYASVCRSRRLTVEEPIDVVGSEADIAG